RPPIRAGKAKTMVQTIAIAFGLFPFEVWWSPARWIGPALMALAVVLTVWSGLVNLKDGLRVRREALAGGADARCPAPEPTRATRPTGSIPPTSSVGPGSADGCSLPRTP